MKMIYNKSSQLILILFFLILTFSLFSETDLPKTMTTIAGRPGKRGYSGNGDNAKKAILNRPHRVFVFKNYVYVADTISHAIRRFPVKGGKIETLAGGIGPGFNGNSIPARRAKLHTPASVFVDDEYVYIAEIGNQSIRRFQIGGNIETIAGGNGTGYSGDGKKAIKARFNYPHSVWVHEGFVYITDDFNHAVRRFKVGGNIETIAGGNGKGYSGDNGPAVQSKMNEPISCVPGNDGYFYVVEYGNHAVRRFKVGGNIETIAGGNGGGYSGDNGSALKAKFNRPHGIDVKNNAVYVADMNNHAIRKFVIGGKMVTLAGGRGAGYSRDNIHPKKSLLYTPTDVFVHNGYVYVTEYHNSTVRRFGE